MLVMQQPQGNTQEKIRVQDQMFEIVKLCTVLHVFYHVSSQFKAPRHLPRPFLPKGRPALAAPGRVAGSGARPGGGRGRNDFHLVRSHG